MSNTMFYVVTSISLLFIILISILCLMEANEKAAADNMPEIITENPKEDTDNKITIETTEQLQKINAKESVIDLQSN